MKILFLESMITAELAFWKKIRVGRGDNDRSDLVVGLELMSFLKNFVSEMGILPQQKRLLSN